MWTTATANIPIYLGPSGPSYGDATSPIMGGNYVYWSSKLFPYHPLNWTNAAFHCPGYKGVIAGTFNATINGQSGSGIERNGSYCYNVNGDGFDSNHAGGSATFHVLGLSPGGIPVGGVFLAPISETQVKAPSEMIAMSDSYNEYNVSVAGQKFWYTADLGSGLGVDVTTASAFSNLNPARHGKNYNQVYCDGHVGAMPPSVLFNPTNSAALWNRDNQPHPEYWQ